MYFEQSFFVFVTIKTAELAEKEKSQSEVRKKLEAETESHLASKEELGKAKDELQKASFYFPYYS